MLTPSRISTSVQWIEHECQDIDVRQGSAFKRECQRLTVPMQPSWETGGALNSCHDCTIAPAASNIHRNTFQTDVCGFFFIIFTKNGFTSLIFRTCLRECWIDLP